MSHTPDVVNESTATTALFLIIAASRQFSQGERSLRAGTWKTPIRAGNAHDLTGRTLGILGLGGIGLHLAHLAHGFPMRIIYHSRSKKLNAPEWCKYYENLEDMLKITDVLSVHLPLRKDTEGFVGEKEIRMLKRGSILVNTARGKVVDEGAMIRALEDGHVRHQILSFSCHLTAIHSSDLSDLMSLPTSPISTQYYSNSHRQLYCLTLAPRLWSPLGT